MAWATREKVVVNPPHKFGREAKTRRNVGEQFSWVLNPGRRSGGGKMAGHRKKKNKSWSASHHRKAKKINPSHRRRGGYTSRMNRHRRSSRNPAGFSFTQLIETGVFATVGAVGSKVLTQLVLGGSNTGIMGYLGNVVAGGLIGFAADKGLKNKTAAFAVYVGTAVQLVLRAIADFTPYGQAVALTGVGDYQVSNFVTPQRYVDALHGAMVEIPQGWGAGTPAVAIQSAGVPPSHAGSTGVSGLYDGESNLYY